MSASAASTASTAQHVTRFLENEHPDVKYLKRDDIGIVLSRALSETYLAQPSKPIEFFAKFLLNHSRT